MQKVIIKAQEVVFTHIKEEGKNLSGISGGTSKRYCKIMSNFSWGLTKRDLLPIVPRR